jgi:16S rRNA processing protein RimM
MDSEDERGAAAGSAEPRFLVVGRVIKPHGVRGEVRVEMHTDLPERFSWLETIYVDINNPRPVEVEGVRFHQSWALLKLVGYDDRDAAERLRSQWLLVPEEQGIPLEEGEYYLYQVVGLGVFTEEGQRLGELVEVLETKANNVFVVRGERGEALIPDIEEVVREIDFESGRVIVHLLPGLVPWI